MLSQRVLVVSQSLWLHVSKYLEGGGARLSTGIRETGAVRQSNVISADPNWTCTLNVASLVVRSRDLLVRDVTREGCVGPEKDLTLT